MAKRHLPPSIKPHPLLGNLREFNGDTLQFFEDQRAHGDVVAFWFGPFLAYIINHPDLVHQVLVTDAAKMQKSPFAVAGLAPLAGNGIFTSDGEFWRHQRRLVQPAFHTKRIGSYATTINAYADEMALDWADGETRDMQHEMTTLTMRIISKVLFDADVREDADTVGQAIADAFSIIDDRLRQVYPLPYWVPLPKNRALATHVAAIERVVQGFIAERRHTGEDKGDLLSMLLLAQAEDGAVMTDKQVRDEALTLFGAGHETTAKALTWLFYLVAQHPEVEARVLSEVAEVIGDRPITFDDLSRLTYTTAVVKETLRLYPPAWATTRYAKESVMLGEYEVEKGRIITIPIWSLHRDPRFFNDPDRFNPDRFLPDNEKLIPKYAYIPFGGGPRVCIGNSFAMMEATIIFASLLRRHHLTVAPDQVVKAVRRFTLHAEYGMRMRAEVRQPQPV